MFCDVCVIVYIYIKLIYARVRIALLKGLLSLILKSLQIYYIYIFGQHMELPRASKISRNSHINQRKKERKITHHCHYEK
jgi:hypothetical protein